MVKRGEKRVGDLKERGYQQAGLYNPAGVGGTHVMYVLQHADKPNLYNDLPLDPKISPWVSLWKGVTKPLLSIGIGLAVLGAFFHYVTRGPKEEEPGSH
jgi:formate dehydrogenase iron-sulfur subunit